jgi:hypothetical protein
MAGGHAVRELLQGTLLFARGQSAPLGDQLLELGLIEIARAVAAGIADVGRGARGRVDAFGWT